MTDDPSLERAARSWLEEGPIRAPDRPVEAALVRVQTTPQERDHRVLWRLSFMNSFARVAAIAVIVTVAIGGSLYFFGRGGLGFGASASPSPLTPSMPPTPRPTPTPVPGAASPVTGLTVVARDIAFERLTLQVASRQPFSITLRNEDPSDLIHDIDIRTTDGAVVSDQEAIPGGTERVYEIEALLPGTYEFICSIHPIPGMTGTLTVR